MASCTGTTWGEPSTRRSRRRFPVAENALRGGVPARRPARWARTDTDVSLHNPRFRDPIADLAAPLQGVAKHTLTGEDVGCTDEQRGWREGQSCPWRRCRRRDCPDRIGPAPARLRGFGSGWLLASRPVEHDALRRRAHPVSMWCVRAATRGDRTRRASCDACATATECVTCLHGPYDAPVREVARRRYAGRWREVSARIPNATERNT